jgi:TonB family protein
MRLWAALFGFGLLCSAQDLQDARSLLAAVSDVARATRSWIIEGRLTIEGASAGESVGDFKLQWHEPNLARYESGGDGSARTLVVCDGKTVWTYFVRANHYTSVPLSSGGPSAENSTGKGQDRLPRCSFFLSDWENLTAGLMAAEFVGSDTVEIDSVPRSCQTVRAEYEVKAASGSGHMTRTLCIDVDRRIVLRQKIEMDYPGSSRSPGLHRVHMLTCTAIQRDPDIDPELFRFVPPDGSSSTAVGPARLPKMGEDVSPPVLVERSEPEYTKRALKAQDEGTVLLQIEVGVDGKAHNIRVLRSLYADLDEKAVECVEKWRFRPGTKNGEPVPVLANIEVNFRIRRK